MSNPDAFATGPRWTPARKEEVVLKVRRGQQTAEEAAAEIGASVEEVVSWVRRFGKHGRAGLRQLKTQELRS